MSIDTTKNDVFCNDVADSPARPGGMRGTLEFTSGRNAVEDVDGCVCEARGKAKEKDKKRKGREGK